MHFCELHSSFFRREGQRQSQLKGQKQRSRNRICHCGIKKNSKHKKNFEDEGKLQFISRQIISI